MQSCVLIPALSCQPKFIDCLLKQLKPDSPVIVQSPGTGQQQTQGRGYMIRGIPNIHTAGQGGGGMITGILRAGTGRSISRRSALLRDPISFLSANCLKFLP